MASFLWADFLTYQIAVAACTAHLSNIWKAVNWQCLHISLPSDTWQYQACVFLPNVQPLSQQWQWLRLPFVIFGCFLALHYISIYLWVRSPDYDFSPQEHRTKFHIEHHYEIVALLLPSICIAGSRKRIFSYLRDNNNITRYKNYDQAPYPTITPYVTELICFASEMLRM